MKKIVLVVLLSTLTSCQDNETLSQDQAAQNLQDMFTEIENMVNTISCDNSEDWTFIGYGSKACGGFVGYIAYPVFIDTQLFIELIEAHKQAQEDFNQKWQIFSDCDTPNQPTEVLCDDGALGSCVDEDRS